MMAGKWGVWFASNRMPTEDIDRLARETEALGYDTLWYPEAMAYEAMAMGGYLLGRTTKLKLATGIANIYVRDPSAATQGHNTLNSLYDGRFILGLSNYRNCWLGLGFTTDDLDGNGSDRFLDAMVVWGTEAAIRARLQAHFDAGADHVAIQPFDPAGGAAPDWNALATFAPGG